jgi:hypothetical protein
MVLNGVTKKNALDDVFWMALYNMSIHSHSNDTEKFYDVLLPFLTGKPLEASLVDAEKVALLAQEDPSSENNEQNVIEIQHSSNPLADCGDWRLPQKSQTAYVRCIFEAMHYMLRKKGLQELQIEQVNLALSAEFICMMKNDLTCMLPDSNGVRVCSLAVKEFSRAAVTFVDRLQALNVSDDKMQSKLNNVDVEVILKDVHHLVESVNESLSYCQVSFIYFTYIVTVVSE